MRRKKALWASSQHWRSSSQVSAHHYARLLVAEGWDVAFLSHPISPWHFFKRSSRRAARERWQTWRRDGEFDLDGHLLYYTPMTLCPPHNLPVLRRQAMLKLWPRLTLPSLRRFLRRREFAELDLLIIDSPLHGFLLDELPSRKTVLRIVDDLSGFAAAAPSWVARERELISRVDHVIVTAEVLREKIAPYRPRALTHVPNGVQIEHFLQADTTLPEEYRSIPTPRAIYVGAIEEWFDVPLLRQVAKQLPQISFVVIGDGKAEIGPLRALENVHLLGRRPYQQLPAYLKHSAVGLIPFHRNRLTRAVNPIKLYEYMACGLPVVATAWEELCHLKSPALLCTSAEEFVHGIASAISQPAASEKLLAFARQADWQQRARLLFQTLGVA
jgi:glycosyltransferase involved in cell wall biosynthesis